MPEGSRVVRSEERRNGPAGEGRAHVEIALSPDAALLTDPGLPREGLRRARGRPGDSRLVVLDTRGGRLIARLLLS